MPRQARLDIPGALHHIMVRGINKTDIFLDDQDKEKFLERLGINVTDAKCSVFAWSLMNNHLHILFKSGERGISDVMRKQLTWYAMYFNRKYLRTGHLFENRYKSKLCEEDRYLLALVRYIHINPRRAGIVTSMGELDRYPWSGHSGIMGYCQREWMDTGFILSQFGQKRKQAQSAYRRFIEEGTQAADLPAGLVDKRGAWSDVVSVKRRGEGLESDGRILGDSDFINRILGEASEKELRQLKMKRTGRSISNIVAEQSMELGLSESAIRSGSRRYKISRARVVIARKCVDELGSSFAEIARYLGVNTSAIKKAISRLDESA